MEEGEGYGVWEACRVSIVTEMHRRGILVFTILASRL